MDVRNRLLLVPPSQTDPTSDPVVRAIAPVSHAESAPSAGANLSTQQRSIEQVSTISKAAKTPESHAAADEQGISSDADVESNDGDFESTGIGSSWVSLRPRESSE